MKLDELLVTIITIADVTQQRQAMVRLNEIAYTDTLTGLPNRTLFDDRLSLEIQHVRRENNLLAVLFIDLDNFKDVNDNHGHHIGDQLLKKIACRIRLNLRETDTVSRRGGDEFNVILNVISSISDSERIANSILQELSLPFEIEGINIMPSASIGISIYPLHSENADLLLEQTDAAMYKAKDAGGNQICIYSKNE